MSGTYSRISQLFDGTSNAAVSASALLLRRSSRSRSLICQRSAAVVDSLAARWRAHPTHPSQRLATRQAHSGKSLAGNATPPCPPCLFLPSPESLRIAQRRSKRRSSAPLFELRRASATACPPTPTFRDAAVTSACSDDNKGARIRCFNGTGINGTSVE